MDVSDTHTQKGRQARCPIAVSNIAWSGQKNEPFLDILAEEGAKGLELAASIIWEEPVNATAAQRSQFRRDIESRGLVINGLHALLFARKDLQMLSLGEGSKQVREYLKRTVDVCADLGGKSLVFGGPRSRRRDDLPLAEANKRSADVLHEVGTYAASKQCFIALEALPPPVCDFITNLSESDEMVRMADTPGVRAHLDTGAADQTEGDIPENRLIALLGEIGHCHVNDYDIAPPGSKTPAIHARWAQLLKAANYNGWLSIEMRSPDAASAAETVRNAIRFVHDHYQ